MLESTEHEKLGRYLNILDPLNLKEKTYIYRTLTSFHICNFCKK